MRHLRFDLIDSTNLEARRQIEAGAKEWLAISASEQSAGRGRQDRGWASPPGNVYLSVVIPKDARQPWAKPWQIGFALALAVADTLRPLVADSAALTLKWPNDTLIGGAKVSGLLAEGVGAAVIAGIGINIVSNPDGTPYPATHLDAHRGAPAALEAVTASLLQRLETRVDQWLNQGFAPIRAEYLIHTHRLGDRLALRGEDGVTHQGQFAGIDADGLLLLDNGACVTRFSTGDVFPGLVS